MDAATGRPDDAAPDGSDIPGPRRPHIGVTEAARITGLSIPTIQRRVSRWIAGDRSDYALRGGRAGSWRYVDPVDTERLAAQLRGELGPNRHEQEPPPGDGE